MRICRIDSLSIDIADFWVNISAENGHYGRRRVAVASRAGQREPEIVKSRMPVAS